MTIFRLHIRPQGGEAIHKNSFSYCIDNNILGVGWQVESDKSGLAWDEYKKDALKKGYKEKTLQSVKYLKNNVKKDDLIWTRDTDGNYYLARVLSGWEYLTSEIAKKADIVNIVQCELKKIAIDDVPGKVIACFRPPRTIQAIRDKTASDYSMYLWNKITETECYSFSDENKFKNIFSFLDAEETEDVVSIYLQTKGWLIIPNSRKADTMKYEFYLIHKDTKKRAIVQVKTGNTKLDPKSWENGEEYVFLFQSNGKYSSESKGKGVESILPKEMKTFMFNNKDILPSKILHWMNMAGNN